MKNSINELSVFLPAYNEEAALAKTFRNVKVSLKKIVKNWEIIIVDDGSKDKTGSIADKLKESDPGHVVVIHHKPNRGYGAAFKSGLYAAKYDWISFIDADGQFDFAHISDFFEKQKKTDADLVIGYYRKRRVKLYRKINTFLWQTVVFLLFGLKVKDIDCGFKLISKHVVDKIDKLESERGAFISSEFLIKARKAGFKIVEIPVPHYPRLTGQGTGSNLNVIIKSFVDLFRLWQKLH